MRSIFFVFVQINQKKRLKNSIPKIESITFVPKIKQNRF